MDRNNCSVKRFCRIVKLIPLSADWYFFGDVVLLIRSGYPSHKA